MGDMRHVCCNKCLENDEWTVLAVFGRNSGQDDLLANMIATIGCEKHKKEHSYDTARLSDFDNGY